MYILVTYDVNTSDTGGARRLSRVAKVCLNYGQRVQNSVFECLVTQDQFIQMKAELTNIIGDEDSIRFYKLGNNFQSKIEHLGKDTSFDMTGELII